MKRRRKLAKQSHVLNGTKTVEKSRFLVFNPNHSSFGVTVIHMTQVNNYSPDSYHVAHVWFHIFALCHDD